MDHDNKSGVKYIPVIKEIFTILRLVEPTNLHVNINQLQFLAQKSYLDLLNSYFYTIGQNDMAIIKLIGGSQWFYTHNNTMRKAQLSPDPDGKMALELIFDQLIAKIDNEDHPFFHTGKTRIIKMVEAIKIDVVTSILLIKFEIISTGQIFIDEIGIREFLDLAKMIL